jgi:hypothetical protein
LVPAELLGYELGLIVPEEKLHLYWHARTGEMPRAGWGTQIYRPEFEPNAAFERLKLPLRMHLRLIDMFANTQEMRSYLEQAESEDTDVLACYDYGSLFDTDNHGGHVNVFDRLLGDEVRLIDPESTVPKWRPVKLDALFGAMKSHGPGKSGGLWELRREPVGDGLG